MLSSARMARVQPPPKMTDGMEPSGSTGFDSPMAQYRPEDLRLSVPDLGDLREAADYAIQRDNLRRIQEV